MESTITYLKPVSFLKRLFAAIIILFSAYIITYQSIFVGLFMIAFAVYLASTVGSQVNLESKTFRNIWSIFDLHFGKWQDLPQFEYISVFKGKQKQRIHGLGASASFAEIIYQVNLFYDRNKHKSFYRTFNKEDAFKVAKHFRLALGLKILDATERKKIWVD